MLSVIAVAVVVASVMFILRAVIVHKQIFSRRSHACSPSTEYWQRSCLQGNSLIPCCRPVSAEKQKQSIEYKRLLVLIFVGTFFTASHSIAQEAVQSQPKELICSLIGGSFDSAGADDFAPLSHKKLDYALYAMGAQLGVTIHSAAKPGSTTHDILSQTDRLIEMYANTAPENQMNCLIIGLSISILHDPDDLTAAIERAIQAAKNAGIRVVAAAYPSAQDVSAQWIDQLSSGAVTTGEYKAITQSYQQRIKALGVTYVDAWRGYTQRQDDFHPSWQSSQRAAVRILAELI